MAAFGRIDAVQAHAVAQLQHQFGQQRVVGARHQCGAEGAAGRQLATLGLAGIEVPTLLVDHQRRALHEISAADIHVPSLRAGQAARRCS